MSLLELITKASANSIQPISGSNYPIILNPEPIIPNLKPQNEQSNDSSLLKRVTGWQISQIDSEIIQVSQEFFNKLKQSLTNVKKFKKKDFINILNEYLENGIEKIGVSVGIEKDDMGYTCKLVEKFGFLMGRDVFSLVLEACVGLEVWDLLETIIVNGFVGHSCSSNLVCNLIEKRRSDLVCLCIKHVSDLQSSDVLRILNYFLSPPSDAYGSMVSVRKEWESQALLAIEMATNNRLSGRKLSYAKEASVLLMMAHDGFSVSELCLHYLLASPSLDEMVLSSCISKLNGSEILVLIRYLGKLLKKFERFPQGVPCPNASSILGLKACDWVPKAEAVVNCFGLILDEHFSSLVLHPEFHEELRSIEGVVNSLALEARFCCNVVNLTENLTKGF